MFTQIKIPLTWEHNSIRHHSLFNIYTTWPWISVDKLINWCAINIYFEPDAFGNRICMPFRRREMRQIYTNMSKMTVNLLCLTYCPTATTIKFALRCIYGQSAAVAIDKLLQRQHLLSRRLFPSWTRWIWTSVATSPQPLEQPVMPAVTVIVIMIAISKLNYHRRAPIRKHWGFK